MRFDHRKLDVYGVALDFVVLVDPLLEDLPPGRGYLALQLRKAAASIVSNVAEGAGEFAPKEKRRFYRIARRSGTESAAQLDILLRLELIDASEHEGASRLLHRIVSMLVKMGKPRDA